MVKPCSHIIFTQQGSGRSQVITFDYLCSVEINQSIETLTDTCTITLPRRISYKGRLISLAQDTIDGKAIFKRGDKVEVQLGYDGKLKTRFIGYIKEVKNAIPIQISCEDSMYLLKKGKYSRPNKECSLSELMKDMLPNGLDFHAADMSLGPFRVNQATPAKVLESLKEDGIFSYFRNIVDGNTVKAVLYVGLAFWTDNRKEGKFTFAKNIIHDSDIQYKLDEDVLLKVKATSIMADNSRIEVEVGDDEGEIRTVFKYKIGKEDLQKFAESEMQRFKYTGYHGTIPTFGEPAMEKGDIANITGSQYNPDGKYLIKANKITSGTQGYKQTLTIDQVLTS